ncbi:MAG: tocopherol cyclase family protein [Bacteroidota bacterium]
MNTFRHFERTKALRITRTALRTVLLGAVLLGSGLVSAQLFAQQTLDKALFYPLRKVYHSEIFQGHRRTDNYYEGWYFKQVSADGQHVFSLIPGVAYGRNGKDAHAFIQLIDGRTGQTDYHRFPIEDFRYSRRRFQVEIGNNSFGPAGLIVDIGEGKRRFRADLSFSGGKAPPPKLLRPGIMGPFRYVPLLETYHGLVSMDHAVTGQAKFGKASIDYNGGRGYIEKDWGYSMPTSWIWTQCNHFEREGVSFMCSIARVPALGQVFPGFLGFLLVDGEVFQFATYTGARVEGLAVEEHRVRFDIVAKNFRLEVRAVRAHTGTLQAPVAGAMNRRIAESVDARIQLRLYDPKGRLLYEGSGQHAGLEVVGQLSELLGEVPD